MLLIYLPHLFPGDPQVKYGRPISQGTELILGTTCFPGGGRTPVAMGTVLAPLAVEIEMPNVGETIRLSRMQGGRCAKCAANFQSGFDDSG